MRFVILLSLAVLAVVYGGDDAGSNADKTAIFNKMLTACEDVVTGKLTREQAVKAVDNAADGYTLAEGDKDNLTQSIALVRGIVDSLGQMPKEARDAFKGLCDKSKIKA